MGYILRTSLVLGFSITACIVNTTLTYGYIGEDLGVDLYTQVDTAGDAHIDGLVKQRLADFSTFAGFGKECRSPSALLDREPMNEQFLRSISGGDYTPLIQLAAKNNVRVSTDSIVALGSCLSEAYSTIQLRAVEDDATLSKIGSVGLYMDGSRENSDYDILTDIEKINTIIFSNPEKYQGVNNGIGASYKNLLSGNFKALRFTPPESQSGSTQSGTTTNGSGSNTQNGSTSENTLNYSDLGLGATCGSDGSINTGSVTSVENMMDEDFLAELSQVLAGASTNANNTGKNFTPQISTNNPATQSGGTSGANSDFFHKLPCDGVFCIRVRMEAGSMNALGTGDSSIEAIIEKHSKILNPISHSDLGQQKMTNNTFQIPFLNIKFKNKIAGLRTYMSTRPQEVKKDKREETEASKHAELARIEKCANLTAGLDASSINSPIAYTYLKRSGVNTENVDKTKIATKAIDISAEKIAYGCVDTYLEAGKKTLNGSMVTDVIQIQAFTIALTDEIQNILNSTIRLDNLRSK